VFVIGTIIVLAGVTLAFVVVSFINSGLGFQSANRALSVATAGVGDALLTLDRDKDFSSAGYSVPVGAFSANVTVVQNAPSAGRATIVSDAVVLARERKIRVVVAIDPTTGEANPISWNQLTL
jgi:hypothetical protein